MSEKRRAGAADGRPEAKNTCAQAIMYMVERSGYGLGYRHQLDN